MNTFNKPETKAGNTADQSSLTIHNPHFITFTDPLLTIDVLGGIDPRQLERMPATLRITCQDYPPYRTTLNLYSDAQTDKLLRTLCDKWHLDLAEVSRAVHTFILRLDGYKFRALTNAYHHPPRFEQTAQQQQQARQLLESKQLPERLLEHFHTAGILGEDDNALILFMALASHKSHNPFSVICLAKSGIGKSYLLQKLADCLPPDTYTFHTRISPNALYYFDSGQLQDKALLIEDMEWTTQMLQPLATLQAWGKLTNTRATKDKDGLLHATTFEVKARLCLVACAYLEKTLDERSLPFLMVQLNHSAQQDQAVMDYQKQCKAGTIEAEAIAEAQHRLRGVIAGLDPVKVINPFAPLIELPPDIGHPRKSLLLLLDFIEVVTWFFQHQRTPHADPGTGEVVIHTHPDDVALAFRLLKTPLFRRADELSTPARGFYHWLQKFLSEVQSEQFTALDIRRVKAVHPRTLNRYLQELKLFGYISISGGNKHREGFIYRLTGLSYHSEAPRRIEESLQKTLDAIRAEHQKQAGSKAAKPAAKAAKSPAATPGSESVSQPPVTNPQRTDNQQESSRTTSNPKNTPKK